jgi:hypothetical protein
MHVAVLSSVETALLVLLVDVGEHQSFGVPLQDLLVLAAFYAVGLSSSFAVEDIDRVGVAAGGKVSPIGVHAHSSESSVAAARVDPFTDQIRQSHQLSQ